MANNIYVEVFAHYSGKTPEEVAAWLDTLPPASISAMRWHPRVAPLFDWVYGMDAWLNNRGYPFAGMPAEYPGECPEV